MALKILATGDIHLGKKSSSIPGNKENAATKFTWDRIISWVIDEEVDVLLLTGDIVDKDNYYFEAIGPLQSGFRKLENAGISVYMVAGNHDYKVLPKIAGDFKNVHLLGKKGIWELKTFCKKGEKIQFVGWSFPSQHFRSDPFLSYNLDELIDPSIPCIGLIHGDVDGTDDSYAPIKVNSFRNKGTQVWVLGHIHKPSTPCEVNPVVRYPGSPHAMSSKESGFHGAISINVESINDIEIKDIPFSSVRYEQETIDISEAIGEEKLRSLVIERLVEVGDKLSSELDEVSFLVFDLILTGEHSRPKAVDNWLRSIQDLKYDLETETTFSVRKITTVLRPKIENIKELAAQPSVVGVLAKTILAIEDNEKTEFLDKILEKWKLNRDEINSKNTYHYLKKVGKEDNNIDLLAKTSILKECNNLLGELLIQKT